MADAVTAAFEVNQSGQVVVISLSAGIHYMSPTNFTDAMMASEVHVVGDGDAELRLVPPDHAEGTDEINFLGCLLHLAAGAPILILEALRITNTLCIEGGHLELRDCHISSSHHNNGGALYMTSGSISALASTFSHNVAAVDGGALYISGGAAEFEECTFAGNRAEQGRGGAIFVAGGTVGLSESTLLASDNIADIGSTAYIDDSGGGIVTYVLPAPKGRWVLSSSTQLGTPSSPIYLPDGALDGDFPYPCAPGLLGLTQAASAQRGPQCSGLCPPGFFCGAATSDPSPCTVGHFCSIEVRCACASSGVQDTHRKIRGILSYSAPLFNVFNQIAPQARSLKKFSFNIF